MDLHIYLPIAHNSVSVFLFVGLGAIVGFLSGLFGVGGGFLLTPLLIIIGIPPTVAAASDSNQIVAASMSGMWAHLRKGNVDLRMGVILLVGSLFGGTLGVRIITLLRAVGNADFVIEVIYVVLLGTVGLHMFYNSLRNLRRPFAAVSVSRMRLSFLERISDSLPWTVKFPQSQVETSVLTPFLLGVIVGVLAGIMGVGGGFLLVPAMLYVLRMPMHAVVGTSLFQIFFTCVNVTFMQAYFNHTVDFVLALILLLGSTLGAQVGARVSHRLDAEQLKVFMASILLLVVVKMAFDLFWPPELLLTRAPGG
jgi:uncharacterized membrane protein YfcA